MTIKVDYTITGSYTLDEAVVSEIISNAELDNPTDQQILDTVKECEDENGIEAAVDDAVNNVKVVFVLSKV